MFLVEIEASASNWPIASNHRDGLSGGGNHTIFEHFGDDLVLFNDLSNLLRIEVISVSLSSCFHARDRPQPRALLMLVELSDLRAPSLASSFSFLSSDSLLVLFYQLAVLTDRRGIRIPLRAGFLRVALL